MIQHVVTVDSFWDVMSLEANIFEANELQHRSILALSKLEPEEEMDPYAKAILTIDMTKDGILQTLMEEATAEGDLVVNGTWCRISIHADGIVYMSTSREPEEVYQMSLVTT
jgi:hypothetical protein